MRILLSSLLLGELNAGWESEFGSQKVAKWDNWFGWSACTNPCGDDGIRIRSRECRDGQPGEGDCKGDQAQTESCSADCTVGDCANSFYDLSDGGEVEVALEAPAGEICFWSTTASEASAGNLVSYDIITYSRDGANYRLQVGESSHTIPAAKAHGHTCLIVSNPGIVKVMQDGVTRFYPGNGHQTDGKVVVGGGFDGSVSELAVTELGGAYVQDDMIRLAQSDGSACNINTIALNNNSELDGAWSDWGKCSMNCGGGRSYRYRSGGVQMWRSCNPQPCQAGWTDWSQWTPCDASCGGGNSHRSRTCHGVGKCEGANGEKQPCNGEKCPQCGYSSWKFPEVQSTTNYLMVKPVLPDMSSVSICFSVENGMNELHGTVFSYSRGLDSPRGNELLFLGKDITNSEIRLYRRDQKISIPNDVMIAGEKTNFCITLQSQSGVNTVYNYVLHELT